MRPDATLLRIDPAFGQVVKADPPGPTARGLQHGSEPGGHRHRARCGPPTASRRSRASRRVRVTLESTVDVGNQPAGIAQGAGATWVADNLDDTVSQIDGAGRLANTIPVGHGAERDRSRRWRRVGGRHGGRHRDAARSRHGRNHGHHPRRRGTDRDRGGTGRGLGGQQRGWHGLPDRPAIRRVVATITVGGSPAHVVVAAGRVWVTVQTGSAPGAPAPAGTLRVVQQRDFNSTDPALLGSYGPQASQLAYATCARLLDYPDRPAPQGTRLAPEIAAAMPTVSANGRTYRYTVRSGLPLLVGPAGHRDSPSRPRSSAT